MLVTKTKALRKLTNYIKKIKNNDNKVGTFIRGMQLNFSNKCNFNCAHCFTKSPSYQLSDEAITIDDIKKVSDEIHELGGWEIDIQGGEPLILPELYDLLKAIDTSRFYVFITTNGWCMTPQKAKKLYELGVDRVTVSIDSFDADAHDKLRGVDGAYRRALEALKFAKEAGMTTNINVTVGSYNAQSNEVEDICRFAEKNDHKVIFNCATPTGNWQHNHKIILSDDDTLHLEYLKKKYKAVFRDLWALYDEDNCIITGCTAVNVIYINPNGDVLPCPYIHTKLGNIKETSLKEIINKGFSARHFRDYNSKCLAGENLDFIKKYLGFEMSVMNPIPIENLIKGD